MFSLPSPPEVDRYDSLPLVHVHDDARELKQFLRAIYDPSFLPFLRSGPNTPALVLSPLKLAIKYQADVLRDRIVNHFSDDCPTTLEDWDEVAYPTELGDSNPLDDTSSQSWSYTGTPDYLTKDFIPDPAPYLMLARECNLPAIFATLLYSLCKDSTTRKGKLFSMTRGDMETLLLGKDHMIKWISESADDVLPVEIEPWIQDNTYQHASKVGCGDERCQPPLFKVWSRLLRDIMCYGDPLATFRAVALKYSTQEDDYDQYDYGRARDDICSCCKTGMMNNIDDFRENLFNKLPNFFPLRDINP